MSNRRKRTAPTRVDEEAKKRLSWNMCDDLNQLQPLAVPDSSNNPVAADSGFSEQGEAGSLLVSSLKLSESSNVSTVTEIEDEGGHFLSSTSAHPSLTISPFHPSEEWRAQLSEFTLQLPEGQVFPDDVLSCTLCLSKTANDHHLQVSVRKEYNDSESDCHEEVIGSVRSSLSYTVLEDILWLQKKKVLGLFQKNIDDCQTLKVGIYLLESGLGKPEHLSKGSWRMRKANMLIQKLMGYFYDLAAPDVSNVIEEANKELERENIEELYDFVRHAHQQEVLCNEKVQHPLLVPTLRPYQCQAVNWMLQREHYSVGPPSDNMSLHLLWKEFTSKDEKKLYYNPYTGCIIRDKPLSSTEWPGGILADEMGLGKTVEMLALILTHRRKDLKQDTLLFPEGNLTNYYIPPSLPPASCITSEKKSEIKPKEKVTCPSVRVMLITAIKEMNVRKSTSVSAIYKYITATYKYDIQRNRYLIKKTLAKLIAEQVIKQVKGHGLAGSFIIGKNYKEQTKRKGTEKQKLSPGKNVLPILPNNKQKMKTEEADPTLKTAGTGKPLANDSLEGLLENEKNNCNETEPCKNEAQPPEVSQEFDRKEEIRNRGLDFLPSEQGIAENNEIGEIKESCFTSRKMPINDNSCPNVLQGDSQGDTDTMNSSKVTSPYTKSKCHFECICGESGLADYKARVQCLKCHLWQHAACVNYKEDDLNIRPFYCPHCLVMMKPVSTSATLIISPSSICHQWVDEINRHVRSSSISILVYQGVKKHGFIQPHALAEHEIVITTYDVLRTELNYVDIPHSNSDDGRRLRKEKRYMAIPSPLVAVEWWRICLDEAQMVECATAKAAEMCLRLSAINRWCVTGTPVQRGLEDLYGLVLFLGVDPYWVKHWWDQLLYQPYCRKNPIPIYTLIAKIMWRTAKKDVLNQIKIPPQTEEVHWLEFSPVERHFYHRQHEICSQDALQKLRMIFDWSIKLSRLDRRTVGSILHPLLRLRQACCHPQAVRGEFLPIQKSTMTMEELLKSLQRKCSTECEEAHRQLVCALNGLAGIHIIRGEFSSAAEYYREVLRSSEEHKGKLQTDSLQRLHATHNLMELLEAKHPGIPPTLRDHKLKEEAEQLKQHYMSKSDLEVSTAQQALQPVQQNIQELQRKIHSGAPWWLGIIECVQQASLDEELVIRVQNEISFSYKQEGSKLSMAEKFRDCRGLQFLLTVQIEELKKSQKLVQDSVKNLVGPPSQEEIRIATMCHLRPVPISLNNCQFCKADELFTDYESKLFSHSVKGQKAIFEEMIEDEEGLIDERLPTTSRGLWAASETERALKAILAFGKAHRIDPLLIEEGNNFMELFEAWKKEYKLLHEYWMTLRDRVSAIDELAMATERFQLRLPDDPKPSLPLLHIIEPHEVEQNQMKLLNDKAVATSQLQKKLGQVLYLTNLEKSQDPSMGNINPDPCPICARQLGQQWAVLTCGHCFCSDCIAIIIEQYSTGARRSSIKCAICRQTTTHKEISYVFTNEAANKEDEFPVKGSHSTKVEAVLRTLKKIQQKEPGAKALVFSTWQDVLDIIGKALLDNNMEFVQINGLHKFQENLSAFKYDSKVNILLLPLHTASNGLNIIEATYVLLVEPILNLAHELQAIGRVHRIGQTKPTVVHRFLTKGTIEERMQSMLKSTEKSHNKSVIVQSEASVLTVGDLADLFSEEERTTDG
ncbi:E3 ubiquitin-protein ligase SHPRH [Pristis pectinata]|uniref:E3 ubiquitin-protein ligase SHPRH n=1 Tax=Pristis pectinata TaxID=685728 RepID=UPI00223D1DD1|nr:E3 ubiquitin-protein ligase SHPRH [Pristis pectinata]XP_051880386.1 E3 ubiquitin-protein ligase SHPRH [Pristis pectinata]